MPQPHNPILAGKKALVVGIANEHSIAYGCASAFRSLGADLAITYLNEKAKPYVEPLARKLEAPIFMPLDVERSGELEDPLGPARYPDALDRVRAQGRPPGRPDRLLGRRLQARDGRLGPFVHPHGEARRAAHDRRRHDVRHELPRRAEGRAELQRHGAGQGGARGGVPLPRLRARRERIRVHPISPGPLKTRAASGLKDFDLLLNEAASRAPIGELVDIDDVGYTCAYLATPYARRLTGQVMYVDGGVNIMA
jgi:enoyl-[acyl-carrier protein] reductase I